MNPLVTVLSGTTTPSGMDAVIDGISTVVTLVGNVFTLIFSNPYLATFASIGLICAVIGVVSELKGVAK